MGLPPTMLQHLNPQVLHALLGSGNTYLPPGNHMHGLGPGAGTPLEPRYSLQGAASMSEDQARAQQLMMHHYVSGQQVSMAPPLSPWPSAQQAAEQKLSPQMMYYLMAGQAGSSKAPAPLAPPDSKQPASHSFPPHPGALVSEPGKAPGPGAASHPLAQLSHLHDSGKMQGSSGVSMMGPSGSAAVSSDANALAPPWSGQLMLPRMSMLTEQSKRRAQALEKYRLKRQKLKFGRVIRYESRKQLAQQRPRVKGQFVKHGTGTELCPDPSGTAAPSGLEVEESLECEGTEASAEVVDMVEGPSCVEESREEHIKCGYGGQNFHETKTAGAVGGASQSTLDDSRTIDQDEGGGDSGTGARLPGPREGPEEPTGQDAAGGHRRVQVQQTTGASSPEEDEDDVVDSLRRLRAGPPR